MNEMTSLPTIPRIYTAVAEWLSIMVFVQVLYRQRRLKGIQLVLTAAAGLAALSLELTLTDQLPVAFWIPSMVGAMAIMYGTLCACCDLSPLSAGYCCVRAFLVSELAASLSWQLYYFYSKYLTGDGQRYGNLISAALVFLAVFAVQWWLERRYNDDGRCDPVRPRTFLSVLAIGVLAFTVSNLSFVDANTPFTSQFTTEIYNIRTLVDLGGVAILYAYHIQHRELHMKFELDAIHNVLETQYVQYRQSRESIEVINRKYHDLKHQIAALRAEPDPRRRGEWLDAMESDIAAYEAQNKTGNSVLDTVLTGKSLYCQKHQINLTCVADGTLLDFMDVMDICTIFGNALDNAIESVLQLKDKEQRLIHLSVSGQKGFLLIQVENYYSGELKFENGLPMSTKGDDKFHGFGVKSIRYSAERYGGTVGITTENHWFHLKILIPLPAGREGRK